MEQAEIRFRRIRMSDLTSMRMQMRMQIYYLQTLFTKQ